MNEPLFTSQIATLQQRLTVLEEQVVSAPNHSPDLIVEALEELRTALEELHVADEELRQQNEALTTALVTLEAERQRYQELFDFAPDGYLVTNMHGSIQEANQAAAVLLGVPQPRLLGKPLRVFVPRPEWKLFRSQLNRLLHHDGVQEWEMYLQPRHGVPFPAALAVAPVRTAQALGTSLRWLLRDITERKHTEDALKQSHALLEQQVETRTAALQQSRQQLRQLATHLQQKQEQERTRIAREVHDELAQLLTGLKIGVAWLSKRLAIGPASWQQHLTTMNSTIDTLFQAVHHIATRLRPHVLDDLGLIAAISWQTQEMCQRTGLAYKLLLPQEVTIDPARATALFRILQEALMNVVRHAEARQVIVHVMQHADAILLEVTDDGKGFDPARLSDHSLGLLGMRERARLWEGKVTITGQPGSGTTVMARLPTHPVVAEKEAP
jgi:PAS domain S-box-containing protein